MKRMFRDVVVVALVLFASLFTCSKDNGPEKETELMIEFKDGIPVRAGNVKGALELFTHLNELGSKHGM